MKNTYLTTIFLLVLLCLAGCGGTKADDTVILSGEEHITDDKASDTEAVSDDRSDAEDSAASGYKNETDNDSHAAADEKEDDSRSLYERSREYGLAVYVYVCGHVNNPGVYELRDGDRICDALTKAGGVSEDGKAEVLAQARPVTDGMTIYVPGIDEEGYEGLSGDSSVYVTGRNNDKADAGDNTVDGAPFTADAGAGGINNDGLNDINAMSRDEWLKLPGIGETKADAIVNYRDEHGDFKNIEELKNVPGIKDGVFNKIKDKIKV